MRDVSRGFRVGQRTIGVLDQLSLTVNRGERVAIMGASGSGKSTLLNLAAGMDRPDQGRVEVLGTNLARLGEPALTRFRARHVSLVFQNFNLIDSLSVRENIALPLWLNKLDRSGDSILSLADTLGIVELLGRLPGELSGGERQRVAI
ncbi:MAG TPA: ABC transporter ATP-binding protein, partial [Wenzhouxiangella sp.]|nr:ABC transporter ATP-binding protein [Wenzhouxiangella sp.]